MIEEYSCNRGGIRARKLTTVHTFCIENAESRFVECEGKEISGATDDGRHEAGCWVQS